MGDGLKVCEFVVWVCFFVETETGVAAFDEVVAEGFCGFEGGDAEGGGEVEFVAGETGLGRDFVGIVDDLAD